MIVSHTHRFIFFAVPRTATHSVRAVLAPHLGDDDWQQERLDSAHRLPIPELAGAGHGHLGVRAIKPHLPEEVFQHYYKFALVRHPYDRFVSVCSFLNRDNPDFAHDPEQWMWDALERERFRARLLVRPQIAMLVDESGELALDFIGRYEALAESLRNVAARLDLQLDDLPHRNRSPDAIRLAALTPRLRRALDAFYAADFEAFDYDRAN
ncbi:MAG: sulfotransferase family 2 domain-containing protein [Pseudomonadota bacterium]